MPCSVPAHRGRDQSQHCVSHPRSDSKFRRDLETLRATFSNFTANTVAEVQALKSQGEPGKEGAPARGAVEEGALSPEHPPSPHVLQVAVCKKR